MNTTFCIVNTRNNEFFYENRNRDFTIYLSSVLVYLVCKNYVNDVNKRVWCAMRFNSSKHTYGTRIEVFTNRTVRHQTEYFWRIRYNTVRFA